ncbi:hypothetical protein PR048_015423 [Dryococelus australis]|uniref:Uncharacterized protein n=1 Tax=Dryococelus australis TaxID=614101 RepID=A0ABQ9HH04_9NEOP|nr:hypothetical protein PR048_015423 [Dryococelus australis]
MQTFEGRKHANIRGEETCQHSRGGNMPTFEGKKFRYSRGKYAYIRGENMQIFEGKICRYSRGKYADIQGKNMQIFEGKHADIEEKQADIRGDTGRHSRRNRPIFKVKQEDIRGERKVIAHGLKTMGKWSFGLSKKEVVQSNGCCYKENKISTPFKDGIPGDDYFKPQSVETALKKSIDPFIISDVKGCHQQWYHPVRCLTLTRQVSAWIRAKLRMLEKRDVQLIVTSGSGRENMTVLMGANAVREKLPPLVVFNDKNVCNSNICGFQRKKKSHKKWVDGLHHIRKLFSNSFLRNTPPAKGTCVDSHVGVSLIEKARKEGRSFLNCHHTLLTFSSQWTSVILNP